MFGGIIFAAAVSGAKPLYANSLAPDCAVLTQVESKLRRQATLEASLSKDIQSDVPLMEPAMSSVEAMNPLSSPHAEAASNLRRYSETLALMSEELDEQVEFLESLEAKCLR